MVTILGVNGSPRKYGNVSFLLNLALKGAEMEGAKVRIIHLYDYDIKPCLGCLSDDQYTCRYPCVIEDDMRKLYEMVLESNGIIFATPIYWYAPSGVMKNFIDRLTVFENMLYIDGTCWTEGKVAGIIAVGNDSGGVNTFSTLMATLNSMGFIIPPWATAVFNKMSDITKERNVLLDAINIGRIVTMMSKRVEGLERKWFKVIEDQELENMINDIALIINKEKNTQWPSRKKEILKLRKSNSNSFSK
ncbi:MAG: flavodoxin family protein [Candidatus Odinarchaeota archaeon]|nr:flavodoxin family protein [Candidatus Odinarchaeota archaeon]